MRNKQCLSILSLLVSLLGYAVMKGQTGSPSVHTSLNFQWEDEQYVDDDGDIAVTEKNELGGLASSRIIIFEIFSCQNNSEVFNVTLNDIHYNQTIN